MAAPSGGVHGEVLRVVGVKVAVDGVLGEGDGGGAGGSVAGAAAASVEAGVFGDEGWGGVSVGGDVGDVGLDGGGDGFGLDDAAADFLLALVLELVVHCAVAGGGGLLGEERDVGAALVGWGDDTAELAALGHVADGAWHRVGVLAGDLAQCGALLPLHAPGFFECGGGHVGQVAGVEHVAFEPGADDRAAPRFRLGRRRCRSSWLRPGRRRRWARCRGPGRPSCCSGRRG